MSYVAQRFPQSILVSCVLPWDESQRLMEDSFRRQVRGLRKAGFDHLYIFGTAGEGYAVDSARFRDVCRIFREETRDDDVHPQVGVIALSTANVVERLGVAHDMGFRMFQISLPSWGELNDREMMTFFTDVCGTFPDSGFLHYNITRARRKLTAADYRRVADRVPNLVATKIGGDATREAEALLRIVPEIQHFFTETLYAHACVYGDCSLLSAYGPAIPHAAKALFEFGRTRDFPQLFELSSRILRFSAETLGPARTKVLIDGAYDKIVARMAGHDVPMRLLSPYEAFSEEICEQCVLIFRERFGDLIEGK